MSDQRIVEDLGRKISERIEELLQRECDLAGQVLPDTERLIMLMKISFAMARASILVGLQSLDESQDAAAFFDVLAAQLDRMVRASKHETLTLLPLVKAGKTADAHSFVRGVR